jgi:Dolichyl-phosphate-mannose-protein mannosyltransferase
VTQSQRHTLTLCVVVVLIAVFMFQMLSSVHQQSQTWDEQDHIFAGYMSWKTFDHGLNPEHPPLVKYVATIPLLRMQVQVPQLLGRFFKTDAFLHGKDFLYKNDAIKILWRTRIFASIFSLIAALLVYFAAREMFGATAGLIALFLVAFEPNLLAHGAYVTTDMALSGFTLATIYMFYRFVRKPTATRMIAVGLAFGLVLSSKHSGVLLLPMLVALAITEFFLRRNPANVPNENGPSLTASRMIVGAVVIGAIALFVLWGMYGFRYAARPAGLVLNPTYADYIQGLNARNHWLLATIGRFHLLPESYLYGLADVRMLSDYMPSYIFGKVYAHGVWYYFPVAFVVKSTLPFLVLLLITIAAIATRAFKKRREILYLAIPCLIYLAVAMSNGINIGARHVLPLWLLLSVLIAGAAASLLKRDRRWMYAIGVLLLAHFVTSVENYPNYIPYSNAMFGGRANTYKVLSDSNTDWGQQLHSTRRYLEARGVRQCWFAYFAGGGVDTTYYGIPCKMLPTIDTMWFNMETDVPDRIEGPVLISAGTINGFEMGSSQLNPYEDFRSFKPSAFIDEGVFVFDGSFDVHRASAMSHWHKASNRLASKDLDAALKEAEAAVASDPSAVDSHSTLADVYLALGRRAEAKASYEHAIANANRLNSPTKETLLGGLQKKLSDMNSAKGSM